MNRPLRRFRISTVAKEQLIRIKRFTGIEQWNVLCRWALLRSLAEKTKPSPAPLPPNSNVELTWEVFAGPWGDVLWYLVKERCYEDGLGTEDDVAIDQFRMHLHRGIGYLASEKLRSIEELISMEQRFGET